MNKHLDRLRVNINLAKAIWGRWSRPAQVRLRELTVKYAFSVALGDLQLLDGRWYVTHSGLLGLAARGRCHGIQVEQVRAFCDPITCRWVFKASVYKSSRSKGFVGYGDADPSNVSLMVHGAEMRVAETRAVNRAVRQAYGIGLCSVEELGSLSRSAGPTTADAHSAKPPCPNASANGRPRLRDQLRL